MTKHLYDLWGASKKNNISQFVHIIIMFIKRVVHNVKCNGGLVLDQYNKLFTSNSDECIMSKDVLRLFSVRPRIYLESFVTSAFLMIWRELNEIQTIFRIY